MAEEALFTDSVGRARALEARLPGPDKIERLRREPVSRAEFADLLGDAGYPAPPPPEGDPSLEAWLALERKQSRRLAREMLGGSEYLLFYLYPVDLGNLFALARNRAEEAETAREDGFFSLARLERAWAGKGLFALPGPLAGAFRECAPERGRDLSETEWLLARALGAILGRAAGTRPMLGAMAAFTADRANIRARLAGRSRFLPGGLLPVEPGREDEDGERFRLAAARRYPPLAAPLEAWEAGKRDGGAVESAFRAVESSIFRDAAFSPFGPEPVLAFLLRRDREAAEIRRARLGRPRPE